MSKDTGVDYSHWIRINMESRCLSQLELAKLSGVSRISIGHILRGTTIHPKRAIILKIHKVFEQMKPFIDVQQAA